MYFSHAILDPSAYGFDLSPLHAQKSSGSRLFTRHIPLYLSLASECSKCAAKMNQLWQIGFTVPCFQHISFDFLNNDLGNECIYN